MRPLVPTLGILLVVTAHLDWSLLAFRGGLPPLGVALAVEGAAFGLVLGCLLASRAPRLLGAAALAVASAMEGATLLVLGGPSFSVTTVLSLGLLAAFAVSAWRWAREGAASLAPGALAAAALFALFTLGSLWEGETFLLRGFLLGLAGWSLAAWGLRRVPYEGGSSASLGSQAGARP